MFDYIWIHACVLSISDPVVLTISNVIVILVSKRSFVHSGQEIQLIRDRKALRCPCDAPALPIASKSSSPSLQNSQWLTILNLDLVVHKPTTLMKRSRKERKAKQQATEVSQIWQTARFVRQMHKIRMPTAFMQFNYVYISLHPVKTRTVRRMQTECFVPLIPVGSSILLRYAK